MTLTPQEQTNLVLDISVTERGQFRSCRRRWVLQTLENLTPKSPTWALAFGTGMHSALEKIHGGKEDYKGAHKALDDWYKKEEKNGVKANIPGEELDALFDLKQLGHVMIDNYKKFDKQAKVKFGKILAVEGEFTAGNKKAFKNKRPDGYSIEADVKISDSGRIMVPIVDTNTKKIFTRTDGTVPYLTGKIDLLVERSVPSKGIWIVDHKNLAQAPADRGVDFDDQITGYCYAVWRWTGLIPRGVIYNVLIKNAIKEPRLTDKGQKLSTAKDQLTTPELYKAAMKEHGMMGLGGQILNEKGEECLNALLARGWDPWFRRLEVTRNFDQMMKFEARLTEEYLDMIDVAENPDKQYPNPSTYNCPGCPVNKICLAMEDGSDYQDVIDHQYTVAPDRKAE